MQSTTYPFYIYFIFILTLALTLFIFYKAANNSKQFLIIIGVWMVAQTIVCLSGFYTITRTLPPRPFFLQMPPVVMIIILFSTVKGRQFINELQLKLLTIIHIIRIPVEVVLFWLFLYKAVPQLITFEGRNFDVLSGISAPVIYYLVFVKKTPGNTLLLIWNFICLLLLINIIINATLSLPTPLQRFGLEQPAIALLQYPFIFLPSVIVPLVLLSHLASTRQLLMKKKG